MKAAAIAAMAKTLPVNERKAELQAVSRQFESLLVNRLVGTMRQSVKHQGIVPQSHAEKVYQSMLDTEYAKQISDSGQLGLGNMIYRHLLQNLSGE